MGWVNPTGYVDSSGTWVNETNIYDDNTSSYGYAVTPILSWCNFLEITRAATLCSKIRVYVIAELPGVIHDIDVYYNEAWHDLYYGALNDRSWQEISLGAIYSITAIRIKGYNPLSEGSINTIVYEVDFWQVVAATVTTQVVTEIDHESGTGNGNITDIGSATPTKRGFCWNTTGSPTVADSKSEEEGSFGTGAFTAAITGLDPNVTYYVKAYAYNSAGYGYGEEVEFTTDKTTPTVTVQTPTDILPTTVTANGNITASGGENATVRGFKYGLTKADTWDVHDDGDFSTGVYTKGLTGLTANTTYWIRAYATNSIGTSYSEWIEFQTAAVGIIPTGTRIFICSDYTGYTHKLMRSETDDGEAYTAYFVISTDCLDKKGLTFYKRILDLDLYFRSEDAGTAEIYVKRDSEASWKYLGSVTLTGTEDIIIKHLSIDERAKHFLFKISMGNACRFLGLCGQFLPAGDR